MIRSKLSDLEKQDILSSFEQQKETILGLAERYQVSSSTIRRLLKQGLPAALAAPDPSEASSSLDLASPPAKGFSKPSKPVPKAARASVPVSADTTVQSEPAVDLPVVASTAPPAKPLSRRRRGTAPDPDDAPRSAVEGFGEVTPFMAGATPPQEEISAILADLGDQVGSFTDSIEDDEDPEDDDDLEDLYDGDEDEDYGDLPLGESPLHLQPEALLEVLPLAEATLPKTCYLVVDRTSELVTRPLKDFGDLGQIPEAEIQSCTLPVFDNGHIARRFSHRTQRVIKVPNGNMLRAASTQLSAKGISRLLINGRIYAL